jgi:uncharacterized protein (DUF58 family)
LLLVLFISYLWALLGIRGFSGVTQKITERCQAGKWFDEEITLFNKNWLPKLFIKVQENTDLPGYNNAALLTMLPRRSRSWRTRVNCRRRGRYHLGEITVTASDPFGLFTRQRQTGESQSIIVYPATIELPLFQPLFRSEPGYGPSHLLISETSPNAARVREYTHSDSYNRIHWQSTAHTGKLMVKVFDPDRSSYASKDIWLILDMHRDAYAGQDDGNTEECCVTIAASLVKKYIDSEKQVGLLAYAEQPYLFPPQGGHQQLWHVLEALALMKAEGEMPVDQVILHETERFAVNPVVIVITPSAGEPVISSLRRLRNRGAMVIAIIPDGVSFGGTANSVSAVNSLISNGVQVYVVKKDEDISRALDSRRLIPHLSYIGDMASSGKQ